jgi:predicted NodU family carbamoyl transferase
MSCREAAAWRIIMKNGYYLSGYLEFDRMGNLCMIAHRHDQCIALWKLEDKKVTLVHYWELERLTGRKQHHMSMFDEHQYESIINDLLREYGLFGRDIVESWGTPGINNGAEYLSTVRYPEFTYHTMCHLSSCLFMDMDKFKNENILAFSVDGGSDIVADANAALRNPFVGAYHKAGDKEISLFPAYSPGFLWDNMKNRYPMREGSLMALASASESRTFLEFEDILTKTNIHVASKIYGMIDNLIDTVHGFTEEDAGVKFNYFDPRFTEKENKISMVMKIVQDMSYRTMERNIDGAIKEYGIKPEETYLAMSGGFALNCPCNTYLMKKYGFKGFIAPPCVSDSGMALGIGLYSFYDKLGGDFDFKFRNAYYGDSDDVYEFLWENKYGHFLESVSEFDARQVAEDMEREPVIWFDGQAEVGPRALGARSLIGDPRTQEMKDRLNEIKLRQWWRPVAPIILRDEMKNWFEDDYESPYMLHALRIREEKKALVPAVVHEDSTARLQSISEEDGQERLYAVVRAFYERTGIPMICNTSLNDKGEPIINRIEEAINFALRKNIRIGYFNGKRIVFKNHAHYRETQPLARPLRIQIWENEEQWKTLIKKYNPLDADAETIFYYVYMKINNEELLQNEKDLKRLKIRSRMFLDTLSPYKKRKLEKNFADYTLSVPVLD